MTAVQSSQALRSSAGKLAGRAAARATYLLAEDSVITSVTGHARRVWQIVTPLGRVVIGLGIAAWVAGWWLGWSELMVLSAACLVVVVVCAIFIVGQASLRVGLQLEPNRLVAGETATGEVHIVNQSSRRRAPLRVELPVGDRVVLFDVPSLKPGAETTDLFVVPTERRGVEVVGPATSVRGDPLGLFHREAPGSIAVELIVHPQTTHLDAFGTGLLRDLEGLTTNDLSVSDLAFHALREYAPGDDRRHVHWRSSAKIGRLLVRQYLDTRRSTLCVVVDTQPNSYGDPDEYETACSVAGSVARRASQDKLPAAIVAGEHNASGVVPAVLLDALSRSELKRNANDLARQVNKAVSAGIDISFAILISGSNSSPTELHRAAHRFPPEVRVIGVQVMPGQAPAVQVGGRATVAQLSTLADLPVLLRSQVGA